MPAPLPIELRQRIVDAYLNNEGTYAKIAKRFCVGDAKVNRLVSRFRRTGSVEPRPAGGNRGEYKVFGDGEVYLRSLVDDDPTWTLAELCGDYAETYGVELHITTMGRALRRLGYTRKRGSTVLQPPTDPTS